jgi:hypothetical protein
MTFAIGILIAVENFVQPRPHANPGVGWWSTAAPAWISAIATAGAFIAASIAAVYGARVFGRERIRDDRLERRIMQEQAALVSAWMGTTEVEEVRHYAAGHTTIDEPYLVEVPALHVRNASELPVYNFQVMGFGEVELGSDANRVVYEASLVPPSGQPQPHVVEPVRQGAILMLEQNVMLAFSDCAGQRWIRNRDGSLLPVAKDHWLRNPPE